MDRIKMKAKKTLRHVIKNQSGQGVLVTVLILVFLGGVVLSPLLLFMSSGLKVGWMHEEKALGYYAADYGIEDAIWKLIHLVPLFPGDSYPLGDQVNEMDVTVEILDVESLVDEDGLLYTVKSTATRGDETKGQIIAEIKVLPGQDVAEGGYGGEFHATENQLIALSILDPHTIIFTTFSSNQLFKGAADEDYRGPIKTNALFWLNLAENKAGIYLDDGDCLKGGTTRIGSVHYEPCDSCNCTLMSLAQGKKAGKCAPPLSVDGDDIFKLVLCSCGSGEPTEPKVECSDKCAKCHDMGDYIGKNVTVASFGMFENGYAPFPDASDLYPNADILFSIDHADAPITIGGETFEAYHVIGYNITSAKFQVYLDVCDILDCPSEEFGIVALAPLADGRLLLSFNRDVMESEVEEEERYEIRVADIAIWTPDGWECEEDEDGECIKDENGNIVVHEPGYPYGPEHLDGPEHLGTITLHIDMHGPDAQLLVPPPDIIIESWQIEK